MLWQRQAIFESKEGKLSSSAECMIRTQGLRHQIASRLNARWQTDWAIEDQTKNLNSTARPYDQRAFSPLDPTASWLSYLALAIYMFVVVNFDALAHASDIRIERRQVVFLCWMQDSNPWSQTPKSPADCWMPADEPTELSRIKLKIWNRQPAPVISDFKSKGGKLASSGFEDGRLWQPLNSKALSQSDCHKATEQSPVTAKRLSKALSQIDWAKPCHKTTELSRLKFKKMKSIVHPCDGRIVSLLDTAQVG